METAALTPAPDPVQNLVQPLADGHLNAASILVWTVVSIVLSVAAGAISGVVLAGKDLGNDLAALIGAMFGPVAAAPGILSALIVLAFL
jgi:hypothetical protein